MDQLSPSLIAALKELEHSAYKKGWNDAINSILKAAKPSEDSLNNSDYNSQEPLNQKLTQNLPHKKRAETTVSRVIDLVKEQPGISAAEMIRILQQRYPETKEKAVRSALPRLKDKTLINKDARWYPNV